MLCGSFAQIEIYTLQKKRAIHPMALFFFENHNKYYLIAYILPAGISTAYLYYTSAGSSYE
jgi:hypothetical protein